MVLLSNIKLRKSFQTKGFFSDSAWMIGGNGIGNGLMLIAGIIIARILGKDLYGEYGLVKTTMFYIASLSTFGLGFTITKYVSSCVATANSKLKSYIYYSIQTTILFSSLLAVLLMLFSGKIAVFLDEPGLKSVLGFLAVLIVIRALNTCIVGILSGLKDFKSIAKNVVASGLLLLFSAPILTSYFSLYGALVSLLLSQVLYLGMNLRIVLQTFNRLDGNLEKSTQKELIVFSLPIALQEMSFMLCNWGLALMIPKLCSFGEYGIYSAANQWNAIILYIPSVLANVMLSYLSGSVRDNQEHSKSLNLMTKVNFLSSLIPFVVVTLFSDIIVGFYGSTFFGLKETLIILILSTVFIAMSNVYSSELISNDKVWSLFVMRLIRDIIICAGTYLILHFGFFVGGAKIVAFCTVIANVLFFISLRLYYRNILHTV